MPEICLLGTGGMMPLKNRRLTSCFIEQEGCAILIDCGEGTQVAMREFGCKISRLKTILITHYHADHTAGLPGMLLSYSNAAEPGGTLDIYCPMGMSAKIKGLMSICGELNFEVAIHELSTKTPGSFNAVFNDMTEITYFPVKHSVACLGYSIEFKRKPVFLPEKAKELNIPVNYWKILHSGESVTLDDGRVIVPEQVLGDNRKSVKITYATDSLPIRTISDFADNSDLFICEGMYGDKDKKSSMNQKKHMLMQDACELARSAEVKNLWLTHYSPAMINPKEYKDELEEIFPKVVISKDGEKIELK